METVASRTLCTSRPAGGIPNIATSDYGFHSARPAKYTLNGSAGDSELWREEGYLHIARRDGRHDYYTLRYGNACAITLLKLFYADPNCPRLVRKWRVWDDYVGRHLGAEGGI